MQPTDGSGIDEADEDEEDDEFEERLLNDPRFHRLVADARREFAEGRGVRIEDLPEDAR
jgi:hypothetical protein